MVRSVFAYPGGKAYLAPWIIGHLPHHDCFVETFAGSAAVTVRKLPSKCEIVNDRDGDIIQFFEVLRNRHDDLVKWLRNVPYARDIHRKWANQFYAGYRPDDPIERAGRFFFLRYSQFASKYRTKSGFSSAAKRDIATKFRNGIDELEEFADRLRHVQIENRDYTEMFSRFDGPNTVFYCDPPYVDAGDALYSHQDPFDHVRFVEHLEDLEAKWLVSYEKLPPGLESDEYHVVTRNRTQYMSRKHDDAESHGIERLVMNYDPDKEPLFVDGQTSQKRLSEVA